MGLQAFRDCKMRIRFRRVGITLIETLVVIAIVSILLGLVLVAVQQSREAARKLSCFSNMRQVALAIHSYESQYRCIPSSAGNGFSFHCRLLPFCEEQSRYTHLDFSRHLNSQSVALPLEIRRVPRYLICPSDPDTNHPHNHLSTNFVGIAGGGINGDYNGVIVPAGLVGGRLALASVSDGTSNTLLLAETSSFELDGFSANDIRTHLDSSATFASSRYFELPNAFSEFVEECFSERPLRAMATSNLGGNWMEASIGMNSFTCIFPKQRRNCGNDSGLGKSLIAPVRNHVGVFSVSFVDGSVRRFSDSIDNEIWRAMGTRAGGEVVSY